MIPRGTRVSKSLEFFDWVGTVIGDFQTLRGTRMVAVELDQEQSGVRVFCATEDSLKIIEGVRLTEEESWEQNRDVSFTKVTTV